MMAGRDNGQARRKTERKRGLGRRVVEPLLGRVRSLSVVRNLARSGEYHRLRGAFITNGHTSEVGVAQRQEIVRRFERIDANVPIASSPVEGLALAELMISMSCSGDIVECGCYSGGSTSKLSIVARITGRRLYVFDSFEGLPDVTASQRHDYHLRHGAAWVADWTAGRYSAPIDRVKENVERFGEIDVCSFTKGWFSDTLTATHLPDRVGMAFTDVDIASSARECITALWPRLERGGIYASHDVAYIKVMQTLQDPTLWTMVLKEFPPVFFGAGFGLGDLAPHLGYAVKGSVTAEYINGLTLEK